MVLEARWGIAPLYRGEGWTVCSSPGGEPSDLSAQAAGLGAWRVGGFRDPVPTVGFTRRGASGRGLGWLRLGVGARESPRGEDTESKNWESERGAPSPSFYR